ncbi:MAG: glycosyltransferase family 2 protein [Erysipelotrichaceae bacterium]|nr:glycosyltransferase family 2 protein [Erysipelotrichaceae bacterium]
MNQPLVSILTPCYNSEPFLDRFLECILHQTYAPIELILINDGSSDHTEAVIDSKRQTFLDAGIQLVVRNQPNLGQAAAFNLGLPLVSGTYFTWIDSDDLISSDSIEKKVNYLQMHSDHDCVRTGYQVVHENNLSKIMYTIRPSLSNTSFFEDVLMERTYGTAGTLMIKSQRLFDILPQKQIYQTRAGQNWQLVLPIAFYCTCGTLDEALLTYVIRDQSHSHSKLDDYHYRLQVIEDHLEVVQTVLKSLPLDQTIYQHLALIKYTRRKLILAASFRNRRDAKLQVVELKRLKALTYRDQLTSFYAHPLIVRILDRMTRYN